MPEPLRSMILVVDDHESVRYARCRVLRRAGYEVLEASTGRAALELAALRRPHLVILDVHLPDISGLEVCRTLKNDPTLAVIPVLHMSATNVQPQDQVRGLEGGADGYLIEPIPPEVLVATVGALLRMHRAESEARESRRALSVLVGNLPGAAYRCERLGGPLAFVGGRVLELTGYSDLDLLRWPRGWWTLIHPDDLVRLEHELAGGGHGHAVELSYRIRRQDGAVRWVWDRATAVRDDAGGIYWEGFATDMTERKLAQEVIAREHERLEELVRTRTAELERSHAQLRLSERLAGLGTLSAGLGHDMGNLLLPLRVRLETLKTMELPAEATAELDAIWDTCEYLRRLAAGLRLLAVDSAVASDKPVTEVHDWENDALPLLRSTLPSHVRLSVDLPAERTWISITKTGLTQAVFNLVQNAGDAMAGRRAGRVSIAVKIVSDGQVAVEVADDGPGMSPEVMQRCIEPFFTTKARGISTGMGLSLVYGLVKECNGELRIDSVVERGSTFTLLLPRSEAPGSEKPSGPCDKLVIDIADPRLRAIVASEARRLALEIQAEPSGADEAVLAVVDRPESVQRHAGRVLFVGDSGQVPSGTPVLRLPLRLLEIRAALQGLLKDSKTEPRAQTQPK